MSNFISNYLAKSEFMSERAEIYLLIEQNLSEVGSRRISTLKELFEAWSQREGSRGRSIALIHKSIARKLEEGQSFTNSIGSFVPRNEKLLLEAGEASGRLVGALKACRQQFSAGKEINGLVGAALAEPAMSLFSILVTSFVCGRFLWPDLIRMVEERFWPGWAMPLVNFDLMFASRWQLMGLVVLLIILYFYSIPRWTGKVRGFFDRVPPWSIYRDKQSAAFLGVLGGLLTSGMELDSALSRMEKNSDPWLRWHIRSIRSKLATAGSSPLASLNTGLFSQKMQDLIEDAARNRSFDETLSHLGTDAMPMIVARVKKMAAITGSVLALITGVFFLYQIGVQQIGVTEATSNFMKEQSK
jgi:type II secretory pathway component PulF